MSHLTSAQRTRHLEEMLRARLAELKSDVSMGIRAARSEGAARPSDEVDRSDAVIQGEIQYALIEMKTQTLARIEQALVRVEAGEYGACLECAEEISETRLLALPFAVRCKACEESREQRLRQLRHAANRRTGVVLDAIG